MSAATAAASPSRRLSSAFTLPPVCDIEACHPCARGHAAPPVPQREPLRAALLVWYDGGRRKLPWRGDPSPWCVSKVAHQAKAASAASAQPKISSYFAAPAAAAAAAAAPAPEEDAAPAVQFARSAYGTWVSEVMLQQTQVERVVEYWQRWMTAFPTPAALAAATPEAVNAAWAGLGYYRRARMLHDAAKKVVDSHGGALPGTAKELAALPGIGPYTSGAIASIAFGEQCGAVDGNVIRVFSRLLAVAADAKDAKLAKHVTVVARDMVDGCDRPGDWTQALMELGATVCTPKSPRCGQCPWQSACLGRASAERAAARNKGGAAPGAAAAAAAAAASAGCTLCDAAALAPERADGYPLKHTPKPKREQALAVVIVEDGAQRLLAVRRPATGLLANQWEFPSALLSDSRDKKAPPPRDPAAAQDALRAALLVGGAAGWAGRPVGELTHTFSHMRHTLHVAAVTVAEAPSAALAAASAAADGNEARWMSRAELTAAGLTAETRKLIALLDGKEDAVSSPKKKKARTAGAGAAAAVGVGGGVGPGGGGVVIDLDATDSE